MGGTRDDHIRAFRTRRALERAAPRKASGRTLDARLVAHRPFRCARRASLACVGIGLTRLHSGGAPFPATLQTGAEGVDAAAHLVAVEELATIDHHRRRILRVARVYVHVAPATEHDGVNFCNTQGARRRHGTRSRAPAFVAPRWHRQRVVAARWHVAIVSCALTQAIAGGIVVRLASNQDRQVRAVGTRTGDSPLGKFVDAWAVHRRRRRRRW